jgi:hypothetical protein
VLRRALAIAWFAAGCGVVTGIDKLENVPAEAAEQVPDAAEADHTSSPVDATSGEASSVTCSELYCNDFESNDALDAKRLSFIGTPPSIDDGEAHAGKQSVRLSASAANGDFEVSLTPATGPIPIAGTVTLSFWWKRGDANSPVRAHLETADEGIHAQLDATPVLRRIKGADQVGSSDPAVAGKIGVWSHVELSAIKVTDGSSAGHVVARFELKVDGVLSATLDGVEIDDTLTAVKAGLFANPTQTTVAWVDDLVVESHP